MLLSDLARDASYGREVFLKRHPDPILVSWSSEDDDSPTGFHTPDGGIAIQTFASKAAGTRRAASDETPRDNGTPIPADIEDTEVVSRPGRPSLLGALGAGESESSAATAVRPDLDLACLPVTKSNRNPFTQMVTVGRTPNNDLVLKDSTVSKFHAYLTRRGGAWWVHDQSSTNGTFVSRQRIDAKGAALADGTRVAFGHRLSFRFFTPEGLHEMLKN